MKRFTLLLVLLVTTNFVAQTLQMQYFPLMDPIDNNIPESFMIEGGENELIMFWIDSTDLNMSISLDDGATWNTPITLVDNTLLLDSLSDLNALKLKNGRMLVTYKHKFHHSIYSDDNGLTWSDPIQLITEFGIIWPRYIMESSLSQTDDNKIWFVYNRLNVIYNIQSDDGINWTEKDTILVFESGGPHFSSINSHWNNSLLLIFQYDLDDTSNIYESVSIDSGKTWSEPRIILDDGIFKQRPRVFNDSNKNLWLTFTQIESTPFKDYYQNNIYYSKLPDEVYSWSIPNKFTEYVGFDGWQNTNVVNDKSYITFTSNRDGRYGLWYGITDDTYDNITPPEIFETNIELRNDYPKVNIDLEASVYDSDRIDSVLFHYQEKGGEVNSIQLFDDGLHNDYESGDYIYGNYLNGLSNAKYNIFYTAVDVIGNKSITETSDFESPFTADGGETFLFDNNNIKMPIDSKGVIGVRNPSSEDVGCLFDDEVVIFTSGFALSGYTNEKLWGNGVLTAGMFNDYLHGPVDNVESLKKIHIVRASQPDFYDSWDTWKDAVKQGADFYDGDGNGVYNPVDLNGNDVWDLDEDKPDILGDITAFTVFNDGVPSQDRIYFDIEPQGIEIKQTVFSYNRATSPKLSNVIFVRYKIENMGTVAETLDSVYFGTWVDMDIGKYWDDLIGTDTTVSSLYTYNEGEDEFYGTNPPACFISFLQGPLVFIVGETFTDTDGNGVYDDGIDTPLDTAVNRKGKLLGIVDIPGAKNNGLTANVHYISGHPTQGMPDDEYELQSNMLGYNQQGDLINPCTWEFGQVLNEDCNSINPRFMYSGDPVMQNGWINRTPDDQRQLGSTGPFDLVKGEPIEIIIAYIVGRGTDYLNSITEARRITSDVIGFYNTNFSYVPVGVNEGSSSQLPTEYSLSQNYPNPFNPSTKIEYSLPAGKAGMQKTEFVSLKVYDVLGREVTTLVNKQQKSGSYEVTFDASYLTSGIYFYRLQYGSFIESKKMILLK